MATTYTIERATQPVGPWEEVEAGLSTTTRELTGQAAGNVLYFRIIKTVDGADSAPSLPAKVVMLDIPAITAEANETYGYIEVSWLATCATLYHIYRRNELGIWNRVGSTSTLNFRDYGVARDQSYTYAVSAAIPDGSEETGLSTPVIVQFDEGVFTMPPSRGTVFQGIQIGPETTPGTLVAATKRLQNMELLPSPQIPIALVKYPGNKTATDSQRSQEHTEATYNGVMDFNLLTYVYASMFGIVTPSAAGTTGKTWAWNPSSIAPITPKTFTVEHGSSFGAEKFGYGVFSGITQSWAKETAAITGTIFGRKTIRNATMTPGLPRMPALAVDPYSIAVYISTDGGDTYTKLLDDIDGNIRFNGLHQPDFKVNDSNDSFDSTVEVMPDFGAELTVEEGTEADNFMTNLYSGQHVYLGLKATGPLIEVGTPNIYHALRINIPVLVTGQAPGDKNNVWGNTFAFEISDDESEFGMAEITLTNKLASL